MIELQTLFKNEHTNVHDRRHRHCMFIVTTSCTFFPLLTLLIDDYVIK